MSKNPDSAEGSDFDSSAFIAIQSSLLSSIQTSKFPHLFLRQSVSQSYLLDVVWTFQEDRISDGVDIADIWLNPIVSPHFFYSFFFGPENIHAIIALIKHKKAVFMKDESFYVPVQLKSFFGQYLVVFNCVMLDYMKLIEEDI